MPEPVGWMVPDSFYNRIVAYLVNGTQNAIVGYVAAEDERVWTDPDVGDVPIVARVLSEEHEVPGINVMFTDTLPLGGQLYNTPGTIHLYLPVIDKPMLVKRAMTRLELAIQKALYGKAFEIINFDVDPPESTDLFGRLLDGRDGTNIIIKDLTNLAVERTIHKALDFTVQYRDSIVA